MEAISEPVQIPAMTDMQKLALAAERLAAARAEAKSWQAEYDDCLERVLSTTPKFERTKFMKATSGSGEAYKEGGVSLIRSPVVKRIIRQDDFIERFPDVFRQIGVVTIKDAEAAVGKDKLSEVCDLSTEYRYKVVA